MKRILILLALTIAVGAHAGETLRIATLDWEPYIGEKMKDNGYVAQVFKEALKRAGFETKYEFYPWARTVSAAQDGSVDAYGPEYYSKDVEKYALFSDPLPGGPVGFFKRLHSPITWSKLEDLKPYSIGVVNGYQNEEAFDKANFLKKEPATDDVTNMRKLLKERLELVVCDKFVGFHIIKTEMPDMVGQVEFISPVLKQQNLYLCFSKKAKDSEKRVKAFNKALADMKKDGTLDKIMKANGF